jgi:hypothetical protein
VSDPIDPIDSERIENIRLAIEKAAGCPARHIESSIVVEGWRNAVVWEGVVEAFELKGHPKAKRAYGWLAPEGEFTTVLEIPPVDSAQTAVKVAIAAKARQ